VKPISELRLVPHCVFAMQLTAPTMNNKIPVATNLVCIIDDDKLILNSFKALLETHGFDVITYRSAIEFLQESKAGRPNCLIVDQNMPGMDGLDLIADLRRRGSSLPSILITGHPDPAIAQRAERLGVEAILENPLVAKPLIALLRCILATG